MLDLLRQGGRPRPEPSGKTRILRRGPYLPAYVEHAQTYQQAFRVADSAFDLYELYVGEDQAPDFDASGQPVQTSATLPFSYTPTPPSSGSTKTLHLVVRKRNAHDLQSFNVYETLVTIDSGSSPVLTISIPLDVAVYDGLATFLNVVAKYVNLDDSSPADTWEVYVTEGADPVVGVDTPAYEGAMSFLGVEAFLAGQSIGPYTPGAVAHVIVVAKRAADSERGTAAAVQFTLAIPLDLEDGLMFGGSAYEQR